MKKIFLSLLTVGLISMNVINANAKDIENRIVLNEEQITVEYIIEEMPVLKTTNTKVGKKTANVKNGSKILWSVTVTGTFTYTGKTSLCTKSEVSTSCPASTWKISSTSSSKSGSTAYASATAKHYSNGLVIQTYTQKVNLSCDPSGKLS